MKGGPESPAVSGAPAVEEGWAFGNHRPPAALVLFCLLTPTLLLSHLSWCAAAQLGGHVRAVSPALIALSSAFSFSRQPCVTRLTAEVQSHSLRSALPNIKPRRLPCVKGKKGIRRRRDTIYSFPLTAGKISGGRETGIVCLEAERQRVYR